MSVDIGSQYLKLGLVKPGVPLEIVLNKESQRKTPNLIGFHNGERLFGESALQLVYFLHTFKIHFLITISELQKS